MTTSIGIRCSPDKIYYSIVKEAIDTIVVDLIDHLIIPKSLIVPEQLKFVRHTFLDIITENKVTNACIRISESSAMKINIPRIYLEAVFQELIASSSISSYYVGQISSICARLNLPRTHFKECVAGTIVFAQVPGWNKYSDLQKESLLAAFSALNL